MNYKKSAVLIFTCLSLANAASRAVKEDTASPEALISRARLQEEIWTSGTPVLRQNSATAECPPNNMLHDHSVINSRNVGHPLHFLDRPGTTPAFHGSARANIQWDTE
jgi:hypothetical protein